MKKLFFTALLMTGISLFAQENNSVRSSAKMEQLTPEQRNQLHLKKLTLDLDLTPSQQKEMEKLLAERNAKKQAAVAERKNSKNTAAKPSADERYAKRNQMLDEQIAFKQKVKKILNEKQYAKWEERKDAKRGAMKHHSEKKRVKSTVKKDK